MFQVICIGSTSKDIFFPTKEGVVFDTPEDITAQKKITFELGAKYHIEDRFESVGGCAVNVACGLQRLNIQSSCYTVLGNDADGEWIENELKKEKVETNLIKKENCLSGLSAIVIDKNSGERIIFSNQEANERLNVTIAEILSFPWIAVSDPSGDWRDILKKVAETSAQTDAKISFTPRGKNIVEDAAAVYAFAGKTELFFVNKDEAIEIVNRIKGETIEADKINDEKFLLTELKKSGAKIVIITDGNRGAWVYDGLEFLHADAMKIEAVDSTGAGDAFFSGFSAGHIKGESLEESLKMGIANSSNVILYYGGKQGLLNSDAIEKKIKKIKIKKLN
ncbi:MAG: Carbohydrate kinase [Candidatus Moranbacteria bacterium GW2011_GWE1_35_17]|nr:MAG: Carbohydrate kinase [Candidatus Moranbacteria bacterium GW2011_GWE1_35_17]KKP69405.1 MAG: Carbohydrate kinase [Candidatus Moranbacteria bacterium GW2011_GWE2_35_164]KKP81893.1 MAG: Carbohydrate kinase [Candidatus Moranbacteria bacterium GW2011_GWF1_35_5]